MSGKGNAGANGAALENLIQNTQALRGYVELGTKGRRDLRNFGPRLANTFAGGKPFYAMRTTVAGIKSIYDVEWCLDLFLWHPQKMPKGLVLECKWQQVGGSADDKLPFSVLSLEHVRDVCGVSVAALMLDAAGARQCVLDWVARECAQRRIPHFSRGTEWARWATTNL